jgi:mono/diheme cytochrome c family protein
MTWLLTGVVWGAFALGIGCLARLARKGDVLGTAFLVPVLVALFFGAVFPGLRFGADPNSPVALGLAMLVTGREAPLPVPGVAFAMYLGVALAAVAIGVSASDDWLARALGPIARFLRGDGAHPVVRAAVLFGLFPGLSAAAVLARYTPDESPPVESRQMHPSIAYDETAVNPFRAGAGAADADALKRGRELFAKNCRPCHGMKADGTGPMARGLRLKPADFTDPGTLATLVEPYARQRVLDGGIGLPANGSPWDSAMPRWKDELGEDEVWSILLAEYEIASVEPRVPEGR